ncbi:MAG: D-alanyl-D-alanine carboxypeptidase [Rhizobiales bacterium]|nr:D-alanyl-D-alanine carboxypeptidase [Hyphomicrobiales bacterium]
MANSAHFSVGRGSNFVSRAAGRCVSLGLTMGLALLATTLLLSAPAFAKPRQAAFVMDAYSGKVLYSDNADSEVYPASLTKVMTLYLLFERLESGKIKLTSRIPISAHAAAQAPSKLGLKPGQTIKVEDAILALVTKSANDIAVAVAEYVGGSESTFASRMTSKARELGMSRTRFKNASGLPNKQQTTTARDMATLAKRIHDDFPQYYRYFSTETFVYNSRSMKNHNHLLGRYEGVTGLKTGYTNASGFNLTAVVERDNKWVIGVVMGGKTSRSRDKHMVQILDRAMPRAVAMNGNARSTTQFASLADVPRPVSKPADLAVYDRDGLDALLAASDERDPDEETYAAPQPTVLATAAPAKPAAAPMDRATAYALAAYKTAEGPVRSVGRELGNLIVTPAQASEGNMQEGALALRSSAPTAGPGKDAWRSGDPLIPQGTWVIQIGAYADQADAVDRIRDALRAAPTELGKAVPVTIPVKTADNKMLYRSRFGGFTGEDAARNACGRLARQAISCIAIPPENWTLPKQAATDRKNDRG